MGQDPEARRQPITLVRFGSLVMWGRSSQHQTAGSIDPRPERDQSDGLRGPARDRFAVELTDFREPRDLPNRVSPVLLRPDQAIVN
jgi:hypothetical protein